MEEKLPPSKPENTNIGNSGTMKKPTVEVTPPVIMTIDIVKLKEVLQPYIEANYPIASFKGSDELKTSLAGVVNTDLSEIPTDPHVLLVFDKTQWPKSPMINDHMIIIDQEFNITRLP